MLDKESVKRAIAEFMNIQYPDSIEREIDIDLSINKIVVIAGVRRAGKTYQIFNVIKSLIASGVPRKNILYINFEDERFIGFNNSDFDFVMDSFHSMGTTSKDYKEYLFFDEIQNIENWARAIRRLYDTGKYHIFLTGSSSKLLSAEISTSLAGRNLTYIMYPFSFREFLVAKNFDLNNLSLYSGIPAIKKYIIEYITYGGFPEISYTDNINTKIRILSSYYDSILFNDISRRYNVSDTNMLRLVLGYAINSYSSPFSASKLFNYLKSLNIEISKKTVNNYIHYAQNVFFLFMNPKFTGSYKNMHQSRKKEYLIDTGFSILHKKSDDSGKLLENSVYIELLRLKEREAGMDIFYFFEDAEIDFIITRNNQLINGIQICYYLNATNLNREIRPLKKLMDRYNLKNSTIIVMEKDNMQINDNRIKIISFYEWALNSRENTL
jgi:predicted AAA+ superfamily ATPase